MRRMSFAAVTLLLLTTSFHDSAKAAERALKMAVILPGSAADGTFNAAAVKAANAVKAYHPQITVSIRENTALAQTEQAITDFARDNYDIIVGYGIEFGEIASKLHTQFPKAWFVVNTASVAGAPNLASFDCRWPDAGYIAGAAAATVTKTGVIGTVGAIPVPAIQDYELGFKEGAWRIKPGVKLLSAYVGSWTDVGKAKEITLGLIEQGADVLTATGNESVIGTVQAAKQKHAMMIGTFFDGAAFAPDTIVTTTIVNFDAPLEMAVGKILDGSMEAKSYMLGFGEGALELADYRAFDSKISAADKQRIQQLIEDVKASRIPELASH
jgi:basic membrane protein A and related proteins